MYPAMKANVISNIKNILNPEYMFYINNDLKIFEKNTTEF